MRICGIDPGAHNGVGIYDTERQRFEYADQFMLIEVSRGKYKFSGSEMEEWLVRGHYPCDVYVVENYIQRPRSMAGKGNEVWIEQFTAEVVGGVSVAANFHGAKFVKQEPTILPAGYGWRGKDYKKDKTHIEDGMTHAYYYARKRGLIQRDDK
jgi:hypothetical protein